ncbi:hypothetical protein [Pseudodesulfovibrio sp.]|uniref:hypothetical protein n=1 Tax=unclassified Pseudodesulfovibrio TaxID=2661612 RepID=UPI003AFFC340
MQKKSAVGSDAASVRCADVSDVRRIIWKGNVEQIVADLNGAEGVSALLDAPAIFSDFDQGMELCRQLRERANTLWQTVLATVPCRELLYSMRMAGCLRVVVLSDVPATAEETGRLREFGFDYALGSQEQGKGNVENAAYSVAEREAIVDRLPGLHAVQYDLAVAYFKAGRYSEVMQPLGKAMTLRFPANELCLNLLACLSAARQYPDMAYGALVPADRGWPHPTVLRNRMLLRSWLESGGEGGEGPLVPEAKGSPLPAQ